MGLIQFPFNEKRAYGHTGGIDGFQSTAGYFPNEKIAVSMIVNGTSKPLNDYMIGALSIWFSLDYKLPEFSPVMQLAPKELAIFKSTYSCVGYPLKLTIFERGHSLFGQGTEQPEFPLEAFEKKQISLRTGQSDH